MAAFQTLRLLEREYPRFDRDSPRLLVVSRGTPTIWHAFWGKVEWKRNPSNKKKKEATRWLGWPQKRLGSQGSQDPKVPCSCQRHEKPSRSPADLKARMPRKYSPAKRKEPRGAPFSNRFLFHFWVPYESGSTLGTLFPIMEVHRKCLD